MGSKPHSKSVSLKADRRPSPRFSVEHNKSLRELLDHIAEELALEYVRLMKIASEEHELK
jgi:hypothetical protein